MTPPPPAAVAAPSRRPARAPYRTVAPRRVSGPARPRVAQRPAPLPLAKRLDRLIDHPLLDRLISGRAWIGIIAFALIGIVAMQVTLLKLNTGIGRSIEQATILRRENTQLGAEVSALQAGDRIAQQAASLGMVYDPAGDVRYVNIAAADAAHAAARTVAPSSANQAASSVPRQTGTLAGYVPGATSPLPVTATTASTTSSQTGSGTAAATVPAGSTGGVTGG